jgi:hypothetical protein
MDFQTEGAPRTRSPWLRVVMSVLLAASLTFGSFALAGCNNAAEEQDNCYGEDMPVVNE